jgi:NAD(P)-dependent dehydrogenase (short-subunit alcohol dehydrogenase family)
VTPQTIKSKVVIITGVSRGLGRAMAEEFVRLGHIVLGCARTKVDIDTLADLCRGNFQVVDVSVDADVKAWAESLIATYGVPDYVINNAAMFKSKAPLWEITDEEFSEVIDINIKGVANVIRHFSPSMIAFNRGSIINFTSRWGILSEKMMAPYCATKWAVVAITRVVAEELKEKGVAVIGLNPGIVRTEMLEKYLGSQAPSESGKYMSPREWAAIAVPCILRLGMADTGELITVCGPHNPVSQETIVEQP